MSLTTAQQVRLKIQDLPALGAGQGVGDGTATTFQLSHKNLTSGTAYLATPQGWSATGATFDPTGLVVFAGRISAGSAFRATYVHSTFAEAEIDHFLTVGGTVNGAAIEAVEALMFDGLKRASWSSPDGSDYDDTAALKLLTDLYDRLIESRTNEAAMAGSSASWSVNQEFS